jgi:purine-nucleoside phosphorylase
VAAAAAAIRGRVPSLAVGICAGSGQAGLAGVVDEQFRVDYAELPGWPRTTVSGHAGQLVVGRVGRHPVAVACGRVHLYEGGVPQLAAFAVEVFAELGARVLVVTNSAGGLRPGTRPGDVMALTDHLNLPGMAGASPLVGRRDAAGAPIFTAMSGAYDPELRDKAVEAGARLGLTIEPGTFAMVAGPTYETGAEAKMLRLLGADAVGMSTVPEVIVARSLGMRVLGLSVITNLVPATATSGTAGHLEVLDIAGQVTPTLAAVIRDVLATSLG